MSAYLLTEEQLIKIVIALVIVAVAFILDKGIRKSLSKYGKRVDMEPHAINILKLVVRLLVVAGAVVSMLSLFEVPTDLFFGASALTGTAIGFASTQTIGNFLAGFYIMISRPFMVRDYVKIGDVEGHVKEITINYTKIYTPTYNITEIPNKKVLDSTIINYSGKKDIIDYTFKMGFPHLDNKTNKEMMEDCIKPTIEKFYQKYKDELPQKPEASMLTMDRLGREVNVRMFFPEGKINEFYDLQPELMRDIVHCWDKFKANKCEKNC
ncbi:MAG: mechanosensitive ion channel family protein [Candidatus Bathyarchaeota archaeon]|nr:mechanosensitive ion channel family protein [Candidatus Bathyarchaeota archaeon]